MGVDFLTRAVRRRWRVAAVAIASGLVVAAITHPDWGVHDYEATHKLYVPGAARAPTTGAEAPLVDPFVLKPDAIAALATSRQTAARAAARLGFDGEPLRLVQRVRAQADAKSGTVSVTSRRRGDPEGAVAIADAVAKELIADVDESRAAARRTAIDAAEAQATGFRDGAGALDPANPATRTRRDEYIRQYVVATKEAEQLAAAAPTTGISTIQPAVAHQLRSHFVEALPPLLGWVLTLLLLTGLGAGLAAAVELTDDRLADHDAAEAVTGLPVLTVVPPRPSGDTALAPHQRLHQALLARAGQPERGMSSSFVVPKVAGDGGQIVLFTSPTAAEATTDTVVNFAAAVAGTGRSALIVDCGDRDDTDASGEAGAGARGVGDLAAGGIVLPTLSPLMQQTSMPRVSLVPRGNADAPAAEFLARHDHLIRSAAGLADVVILHGPGVLSGDPAVALSKLADDTLLVCRAGATKVADARKAAAALYDANVSAGVVVIDEAPPLTRARLAPAELMERVRSDPKVRGRLEWAGAGVGMLVLYVLIRSFVMESFSIPTASMAPYLEPGDRVLANRLSYRLHDVHRGDVIVFKTPKQARPLGGDRLIKRVIGLPGDTVESKDGHVLVNGKQLPETYLQPATKTENVKRATVPAGRYWVMGDNRGNSADSRFFGAIPRSSIIGRAFFHLWPWPIGLM